MPRKTRRLVRSHSHHWFESLECRRLLSAGTIRVAAYNVDGDTTDFAGNNQSATLETVLEGIASEHLNDNGVSNAQMPDVLGFEELQNSIGGAQAPNLPTIVSDLNTKYGAGTYAFDPTADPTTGNTTGNGPSGLVYNTHTIQVLSAAALGTVSGSGEARAPMQYKLHPVGFASTGDFYVIVSHMKSGTTSTDANRRNVEAQVITSAITSLGSSAHVIVMGDFNITGGSAETTYGTLKTKTDDVSHPSGSWSDNTVANAKLIAPLLTESDTSVHYRDDIQFVSPAADPASSSAGSGLQYDSSSYLIFGNGGATTIVSHAVTDTTNNPGALSDLSSTQRTAVLSAETTTTDHLPVVADYTLVGLTQPPPPGAVLTWNVSGQTGYGTQGLAATTVASGVTNSLGLTRGSGVTTTGTAASNAWGGTGWASTSSAGISGNKTVSFAVTVGSSKTLSLSAIDMNYRRSSTGPGNGYWQYEIGTGAWNLIGDFSNEFSSTSSSGAAINEINLSGISGLQNLAAGTKVTFRVTPYGATSSSGTWYIYHISSGTTDLALNGSIGSTGAFAPAASPTAGTASMFSLGTSKQILFDDSPDLLA